MAHKSQIPMPTNNKAAGSTTGIIGNGTTTTTSPLPRAPSPTTGSSRSGTSGSDTARDTAGSLSIRNYRRTSKSVTGFNFEKHWEKFSTGRSERSGSGITGSITSIFEQLDMFMSPTSLRAAFNEFDKDRDGYITSTELLAVMTSLRQNVTRGEIHQMIRHVDIDGKGKVSFDEFVSFMISRQRQQNVSDDEMLEAFHVFDTDGDGYINGEDIRKTMRQLGEELSAKDVKDMMFEADLDKDGRINFAEFIILMNHRFIKSGKVLATNGAFNPEQKGELRIIFSLFDKDHDNNISMDEVMQVMKVMGQQPDLERLRETFQLVDLDGNGLIDFNEFVQMIENRVGRQSDDAEMRALFAAFDKDSNGYIDAKELKQTMAEIGMPVSAADVKQMLREAGVAKKHGRIYYEDFLRMMTGQIGDKQRSMATLGSTEADSPNRSDDGKSKRHQDTPDVAVAFAMFDKDGDGVITCREVLQVMVSLGIDVDSSEVREIVRKIDLDGNGVIEFEEFAAWAEKHKPLTVRPREAGPDEEEMMQLFRVFDKDGDGSINAKDLHDTMKDLGLVLTRDDTTAMMKEAGLGPDGNIHYKEFCQMMCPLLGDVSTQQTPSGHAACDDSELRVMFTEFDQDQDGLVGIDEVRRITHALGHTTSKAIIKNHFNKFDDNGNGLINYPEFLQLLQEVTGKKIAHSPATSMDMQRQTSLNVSRVAPGNKEIPVGPFYPSGKEEAEETQKVVLTNGLGSGCIAPVEAIKVNGVTAVDVQSAPPMNTRLSPCSSVSSEDTPFTKELKTAFLRFSQTTEGAVTSEELRDMLQSLSYDTRSPSLREMLERVETDGNGQMTLDEFLKAMPSQHRTRSVRQKHRSGQRSNHPSGEATTPEPEAWTAFKVFDRDHNGYITMSELRQTMKDMGMELSDEEVELMMHRADTNGDGRIDYKEFIRMVQSNRFVKQVALRQQSVVASATSQSNGGGRIKRTSSKKSDKLEYVEPTTPKTIIQTLDNAKHREAFERFDATDAGHISVSDAVTALNQLGLPCDPNDARDGNCTGNGTINFDEFIAMMKASRAKYTNFPERRRKTQEIEMRAAFKVFDINGDGLIDESELKSTMQNLGERVISEDIKAMIRAADRNGDGKIDYEEFIDMMYSSTILRSAAYTTSAPDIETQQK